MMMLGYVVGGLALFGGSILAATIAVALAGMSGMRLLRKLLSGGGVRVVPLYGSQYPASQSQKAATTPTSCNWTAASTPKFADLILPVVRVFRVGRSAMAGCIRRRGGGPARWLRR